MRTAPRLLPTLRSLSSADVASLASWVLGLTALEVYGREVRTDVGDAVGLAALVTLGWVSVLGARAGRLSWLRALPLARLRRIASRSVPEFGIDLRQDPPLPRGTPPLVRALGWALAGLLAAAWLAREHLPHALRDTVAPISYVLYLVLLGLLWAALAGGGLFALLLSHLWVHDRFVERRTAARSARRAGARASPPAAGRRSVPEPLVHLALATLVGSCAWRLDALWALIGATAAASFAAACHALPVDPPIVLLWRPRRPDASARSWSWRRSMQAQIGATLALVLVLALAARGSAGLAGRAATGSLRLTPLLGTLFPWAAAQGLTVLALQALRSARAAGRFARAAARAPAAWIEGAAPEAEPGLRETLARRGWRASFAPERAPEDAVRVRLEPGAGADPWSPERLFRRGLRRVSAAELDDPCALARLERAREIHLRRRLGKGLEALLGRAARRRYRRGSGYWIAPQYWFVSGLSRDETEEQHGREDYLFETILDTPYERCLPWAARVHFQRVTRALAIDLVFLEDGVGARRLRRVLDLLFEVYDVHGGRARLEERHLIGLVGLRPVIHEVELGRPFRRAGYPEPEYEDLARARVLHVFKDRGGGTSDARDPEGVEGRPVLVPAR